MQWKIREDESHWLEVAEDVGDRADRPMWAFVKWDGCAEIHTETESPKGQWVQDFIHVCDFGGFVDALIRLREMALERGFEVTPPR